MSTVALSAPHPTGSHLYSVLHFCQGELRNQNSCYVAIVLGQAWISRVGNTQRNLPEKTNPPEWSGPSTIYMSVNVMELEPKQDTVKRPYVFKRNSFGPHTSVSLADYFIKGVEILHLIYSWPIECFITCKRSNVFWGQRERFGLFCSIGCLLKPVKGSFWLCWGFESDSAILLILWGRLRVAVTQNT